MEEKREYVRKVFWTAEFKEFFDGLSEKVKAKFDYVLNVITIERVISTKFVKHLEGTDLYEMRVSVGNNEYRTILFTIDDSNIIQATKVILLNAFMKKSTKDYKRQIKIAENILRRLNDENED